ncbi:cellulase family glycosylhydrolase [Herpetosiphon llansteffanensis]
MHKRLLPLVLALVLVVTPFLLANPATPAAAAEIPWGDKTTPFGMVVSLGNRVRSDEMPTMIRLMREAGVQWNREEIWWDQVQFEPDGPFRWDGDSAKFYNYDRAIQLQAEAGINVLGLLDYNPAWFKGRNPHPEEWLSDWGDYVYATVARYGRERGQIKYWEVWNEPNLVPSGYESGLYNVDDFVRVLQTASAAIRAADPEAKIVLGGVADIWSEIPEFAYDTPDYLQRLYNLGAWPMFDILGLHPYRPDAPEVPVLRRDRSQTYREQAAEIDALLAQFGSKPIWYTEVGWSTESDGIVDEAEQAAWLQRFYLLAMTHPGVEKIFWYDFRNDTGDNNNYTRPINDPTENQFHFGMLRRTYPLNFDDQRIRKPSYSAYYHLTHNLGGLSWQANYALPYDGGLGWQHWSNGDRSVDILWWVHEAQSPPYLEINCDCKHVQVRAYDGTLLRVVNTDTGTVKIQPDQRGMPIWVEYGGYSGEGRSFDETPHTILGGFLSYWEQNGGLARFGLPLTDELTEPGPGRLPTIVQYFERNRFELHPNNQPEFRVQLSLLGVRSLERGGVDWRNLPPAQNPPAECSYFIETGHSLCYPFKQYWEQNGGIALYGFPVSEAYWEYDEAQGKGFLVQYFERNRFEHHPELAGSAYEIQLGLLGRQLYQGWAQYP